MTKYIIFAFNGNPMCFTHVLLNALDMDERGLEIKVIIEGEAVKLVQIMIDSNNLLFAKARDRGLIDGICKACSSKMGVLGYNEGTGLPLLGDMSGHPSMGAYIDRGYALITL